MRPLQAVEQNAVLSDLSHQAKLYLVGQADVKTYAPGELIFSAGATSNTTYLVCGGTVKLEGEAHVPVLKEGELFAEIGLFEPDYRTTRMLAARSGNEGCRLVEWPDIAFHGSSLVHDELKYVMIPHLATRLVLNRREWRVGTDLSSLIPDGIELPIGVARLEQRTRMMHLHSAMMCCPLFANMRLADVLHVLRTADLAQLGPNGLLFEQGAKPTETFVLVSGQLMVGDGETTIRYHGSPVGEVGLTTRYRNERMERVYTRTGAELLRITDEQLAKYHAELAGPHYRQMLLYSKGWVPK